MGAVLVLTVLWARHEPAARPGITLEPVRLLADGYDTATLTFHSAQRPRITIDPFYAATVEKVGDSTARIRAGRWWWEQGAEKECGIHIAPNGQVMRQVDALIAEIRPAAN